jgi:hypothetical protein
VGPQLDSAEGEEEPSPNMIDHHLMQSYKTLTNKLGKKCVWIVTVWRTIDLDH